MIRKLRWRIILMNMGLIGIVIIGIFTAVCINDYTKSSSDLEHGMNQVFSKNIQNFDMMPETDDEAFLFNKHGKDKYFNKPDIHENAPMEISSYVIVHIGTDGEIADIQESNVSINEDDLKNCVQIALARPEKSGQINDYGLMYVKKDEMQTTEIIFADNSNIYSNLWRTILICAALFVASMIIILLISLGLSWLAVKPVKKAWEQQKQFVADASHELKTPLTVILANNNIMMSHPRSTVAEEQKWLESTEDEAQHMKQLIDQMLFLAKSDAGDSQLQLSEVNLSEIIEGSSLNFEPVAFEKDVMIDADIAPDIIIEANQTQLNQLAHILIDNAVKYADKSSTISI
ncbi:MAG: HAMP domain-containing histidine kinase, partial [Ruminococcus sp.]|nr:HAMP domain-containing histidine kinase [Ruminococcus sp.]